MSIAWPLVRSLEKRSITVTVAPILESHFGSVSGDKLEEGG